MSDFDIQGSFDWRAIGQRNLTDKSYKMGRAILGYEDNRRLFIYRILNELGLLPFDQVKIIKITKEVGRFLNHKLSTKCKGHV